MTTEIFTALIILIVIFWIIVIALGVSNLTKKDNLKIHEKDNIYKNNDGNGASTSFVTAPSYEEAMGINSVNSNIQQNTSRDFTGLIPAAGNNVDEIKHVTFSNWEQLSDWLNAQQYIILLSVQKNDVVNASFFLKNEPTNISYKAITLSFIDLMFEKNRDNFVSEWESQNPGCKICTCQHSRTRIGKTQSLLLHVGTLSRSKYYLVYETVNS